MREFGLNRHILRVGLRSISAPRRHLARLLGPTVPRLAAAALVVLSRATAAAAADPGITTSEIVLGGTHPFSGPASAYGNVGKAIGAYFDYVNDRGGVNGRKIKWLDLDDEYNPAQTVQLIHKLVEQDKVFAVFNTLGTEPSKAVRPYLNQQGVPQLFVGSGAPTFSKDHNRYPWTIGWQPDYTSEAFLYARDIVRDNPKAKIAVLYQNDDYGEDSSAGFRLGLGSHQDLIVRDAPYDARDDVGAKIAMLRSSGADTLVLFAIPSVVAQALTSAAQQSWRPAVYLSSTANSATFVRLVARSSGGRAVEKLRSAFYLKDPSDSARYAGDAGIKLYRDILRKYLSNADPDDSNYLYGVAVAYSLVDVLRKAGRDLTRQRVIEVATNLDERDNPFLYPSIVVKSSSADPSPIGQLVEAAWHGNNWSTIGPVVNVRAAKCGGTGNPCPPPHTPGH